MFCAGFVLFPYCDILAFKHIFIRKNIEIKQRLLLKVEVMNAKIVFSKVDELIIQTVDNVFLFLLEYIQILIKASEILSKSNRNFQYTCIENAQKMKKIDQSVPIASLVGKLHRTEWKKPYDVMKRTRQTDHFTITATQVGLLT